MTEGKKPKWRQLADDLGDEIRRGERAPGSALPQIREWVEETGWAYDTVRNAYRALEDEGLVNSRKGQGTYVAPILGKIHRDSTGRYSRTARESAGARGAFAAEIARLGMQPSSATTVTRERPPDRVAKLLEISPHSVSALVRTRIMRANDVVVQVATSYFPGEITFGTQLEDQDTGEGGSKSRLAELGHAQVRIRESVDVRQPTKEEAAALGIPTDRPVYEITHAGITAADRAVEVCLHVMPVTLWTLSYEWSIDQPDA